MPLVPKVNRTLVLLAEMLHKLRGWYSRRKCDHLRCVSDSLKEGVITRIAWESENGDDFDPNIKEKGFTEYSYPASVCAAQPSSTMSCFTHLAILSNEKEKRKMQIIFLYISIVAFLCYARNLKALSLSSTLSLSISLNLCIYLSIYPSIYLRLFIYVHVCVWLVTSRSLHLSLSLSNSLSLSLNLCLYLFIYLSQSLHMCAFVCVCDLFLIDIYIFLSDSHFNSFSLS